MATPITLRNDAIQTAKNILSDPEQYALIDTETTGTGKTAEALELAIVTPLGEKLFSGYFEPKGKISPYSIDIHGLSPKVLKAKGAIPYGDVHETVAEVLDGRTVVAYNVGYDLGALDYTASLFGLDTPVSGDSLCAMALTKRFNSTPTFTKLGGDHSAMGDVLAMVELLKQMSGADILADPDAIAISSIEELANIQYQIDELSAKRKAIQKQEAQLKQQQIKFMLDQGKVSIPLGDGRQVALTKGYKGIKPLVDITEVPDIFTELVLSRKALNAHYKARGGFDTEIFTYEDSYTVKPKKL